MIYFQDFSGCVFGIIENKMEVVVRKGEKHDNHTWHTSCILFKKSDCKSSAVKCAILFYICMDKICLHGGRVVYLYLLKIYNLPISNVSACYLYVYLLNFK